MLFLQVAHAADSQRRACLRKSQQVTLDLHNCSMYAESVLTAATLPCCSGPKSDLPSRHVTATEYTCRQPSKQWQ